MTHLYLKTYLAFALNGDDKDFRRHLNDFLFYSNEDIAELAGNLSGGEKARLSLACIAARNPHLLLLDEVTNNLDIETKEHVAQVIRAYPGALLLVSHDEGFIDSIDISWRCEIREGKILL